MRLWCMIVSTNMITAQLVIISAMTFFFNNATTENPLPEKYYSNVHRLLGYLDSYASVHRSIRDDNCKR
jgi:hypothetical protein